MDVLGWRKWKLQCKHGVFKCRLSFVGLMFCPYMWHCSGESMTFRNIFVSNTNTLLSRLLAGDICCSTVADLPADVSPVFIVYKQSSNQIHNSYFYIHSLKWNNKNEIIRYGTFHLIIWSNTTSTEKAICRCSWYTYNAKHISSTPWLGSNYIMISETTSYCYNLHLPKTDAKRNKP